MKEKATVVSAQKKFARVKVTPTLSCHECSARSLCIGQKQEDGTLIVLNPVSARPGDEVNIQIPERDYNRELIFLFSTLLGCTLAGLLLGRFTAVLLGLPATETSLAGIFVGLASGSFLLFRRFHQTKKNKLYPVIINIDKKGDSHG